MKKILTILNLIILFVFVSALSGCNLFIGMIDDFTSPPSSPEIAVYYQSYKIPCNNSEYNIGTAIVSTSKDIIFTIRNDGDETLTLSGDPAVRIDGAQFSLVRDVAKTIPSYGSSSFSVSFHPEAAETYQAVINIDSNDPDKSSFHFTIYGDGSQDPRKDIFMHYRNMPIENGSTLDMGNFSITKENKEILHIINRGTEDLCFAGEQHVWIDGVDGTGNTCFNVIIDADSPVAPGDETTCQISITPENQGIFKGYVQILGNDSLTADFTCILECHGI